MTTPIPDSERILLLAAEREISAVETILIHTEGLSDIGKESAVRRLKTVRSAISSFRSRYGLAS